MFEIIHVLVFCVVCMVVGAGTEKFTLTSDQPGILGWNVTFYARLDNPSHDEYTIAWQENFPYERRLKTSLDKENGFSSNWSLAYIEAPGNFSITVIVTHLYLVFDVTDVSLLYNFEVKENFSGSLEVHQLGVPRKEPTFVSTLNETELYVKVHDPSKHLENAVNLTYTWFRNNSVVAETSVPTLYMNFTKEDVYPILVNLAAAFNDNGTTIYKYGSFAKNVSAKVPIVNFHMTGATWFRHGNLLDLHVTCNGTPPYEYCWMVKTGPYNETGNESCQPAVTTDCSIRISRYLEAGTYTLLMLLNNDVGRLNNQTGIHVYKTTTKPQLSIIIVPISATLIAVVLIIFGVAYYWENHVRYNVEVADFDFGQADESPCVGFVDRLRDSVSLFFLNFAVRGRRGSLLLPPDNDSRIHSA